MVEIPRAPSRAPRVFDSIGDGPPPRSLRSPRAHLGAQDVALQHEAAARDDRRAHREARGDLDVLIGSSSIGPLRTSGDALTQPSSTYRLMSMLEISALFLTNLNFE